MSEQGYMHRRVQVEIAWFMAMSDAGFAEFKPLSLGARRYLTGLVAHFSEQDALAIKDIEKTTNHDVKAVEYWLKSKFKDRPELELASEFVHFACTSEDINNTSHALQLQRLARRAKWSCLPMLDTDHHQTAKTWHMLMRRYTDAQPDTWPNPLAPPP